MNTVEKMKKELKKQAHHLKPVVMLGNSGLTENVHHEIETALESHELIKIRISGADNDKKNELIQQILSHHQAELIDQIGHVIVIYKKKHQD
jgi:RNA-binding protein